MAERILMRRFGEVLVPANEEAQETLGTLPVREDVAVDVVRLRNGALHRRAFAYIALANSLWNPKNLLSATEKETVRKLGKFLVGNGLDHETVRTLCSQFLGHLNNARKGVELERDIDSFRDFVTIEAGFYRTIITPAGPRRLARSWAYKNMPEGEFQRLFSAIRETCWRLVLSQEFKTIEEADVVAQRLMEFD